MLTILIADDEKLERNGIKFLLKREKEEFQIIEAVNGKDALGVLASHHVDLLLTDVKMPYMNGLELSAHVKDALYERIGTVRSCKGELSGSGDRHIQRVQ